MYEKISIKKPMKLHIIRNIILMTIIIYNVLSIYCLGQDIYILNTKNIKWAENEIKELNKKVKTDPYYSYTLILIEVVDIYIDTVIDTPCKKKLSDIIKFIPRKQLLII